MREAVKINDLNDLYKLSSKNRKEVFLNILIILFPADS